MYFFLSIIGDDLSSLYGNANTNAYHNAHILWNICQTITLTLWMQRIWGSGICSPVFGMLLSCVHFHKIKTYRSQLSTSDPMLLLSDSPTFELSLCYFSMYSFQKLRYLKVHLSVWVWDTAKAAWCSNSWLQYHHPTGLGNAVFCMAWTCQF